jgi:hypothetical protein
VLLRVITVVALIVTLSLSSSCITVSQHLREADVVKIADRVAINHGYRLSKFRKVVEYNLRNDRLWRVFYTIRPDSHGMVPTGFDFTVYISDDTKKTYLIPGR